MLVKFTVHGKPVEVEAETLADLLAALGYRGYWYATALNSDFVLAAKREKTRLCEGDHIEIVTPMQGG
jgi:sulfur carrier protein